MFCDGTFDVSPKLFMQVYSIHCLVQGRCLPVVYGVLPRKTEAIYVKFLQVVSKHLDISPKSITSDFEKAFMNACATVFPSSALHGCFFHFKQSMFRRIQDLGLVPAYMSNGDTRKLLKLPQVLAFVPICDVTETFLALKAEVASSSTALLPFYEYVQDNYIGKKVEKFVGRGKNKRTLIEQQDPPFAISLWNVHARINDKLPRTNNFVEAWHNAFGATLKKHPLVYELVDAFRKENKKMENTLVKLKTGIEYKRKPEYIVLDERIQNVVRMYNKVNFNEFFENLGLILKY